MSTTAMIKTVNTLFAPPSDEVYTVFQSEGDLLDEANSHGARPADRKLGTLGFFGRVLEGTGIVAFALAIAIVTMTTGD